METDLIPFAYMGSVLLDYFSWVMLAYFILLPVLLLITNIVKFFIGILKRAGIYG